MGYEKIMDMLLNWESVAVIFGLLYVLFAARGARICWIFGLISVSIYFFLFAGVRLFSDALLQLFYAAMSIYGWLNWRENSREQSGIAVQVRPIRFHIKFIGAGILLTFLVGWFWTLFDAALPYIDAFTTVFSILATLLVARKVLENWLYWIVIDLVASGVYVNREMYLTAVLFLLYTLISIHGWYSWRNFRESDKKVAD